MSILFQIYNTRVTGHENFKIIYIVYKGYKMEEHNLCGVYLAQDVYKK